MSERAHIISVEALEAFRANLIVYLNAARPTLDEIRGEIIRSRLWLEGDRQGFWESQIRRRTQKLRDAEAELFKVRLSNLSTGAELAQALVRRAKESLGEAEAKLKAVRKWIREFDQMVGPGARTLDLLRERLAGDLGEAVVDLSRTTGLLADYAGLSAVPAPPSTEAGEQP